MTAPQPASRHALPGPRPVPLLGWRGNLLAFARDPIAYAARLFAEFGDLAALRVGAHTLVFVLGPEHNATLLSQPAVFCSAIGLDAAPGSAGLKAALLSLTATGGEWERFYCGVVADTTRSTAERWGIGQQLDAAWAMQRLSCRIAARALWGLERSEDIAALLRTCGDWRAAGPTRLVLGASIDVPGTPFASVVGLARSVEQTVLAAYAASRARGEAPFMPASLIARLTADGDETAAVALLAHVFAAGYGAVAASLIWTLFLLTQHTSLQAELHAEARAADAGDQAAHGLNAHEQLGRAVRESLRLFPPCAFGMRSLAEGANLGRYMVPRGARVVYSPYLTHRLPERYFWPHRFRPERWLHVEPEPGAFLPFGGAPRATLGPRLAELEIGIVLSTLLRRFVFGLAPGARIDRSVRFALMPRAGLPLVVSPPDRPVRRREPHGDVLSMVEL